MSGITEGDKEIAFDFIVLNIVITALEVDIAVLEKNRLKLKSIHISHLNKLHHEISNDLTKLKKYMFKRGIKVLEKEIINEDFWRYQYFVRGYEAEFRCFKPALKMHSEKKIAHYFGLS